MESVADLRALDATEVVFAGEVRFLKGYYSAFDGGGSRVYYDSLDTTTADDGGSTFVDLANRRWKRLD